MSTALMSPPARPPVDRSAHEIITAARTVKTHAAEQAPVRGALVLSVISAALLWLSFMPVNWSPLAWLAPVPLLMLVRLRQPTRWMSATCYLGGLAFYLSALQWMRLGDPTMYLAWWALAFYLAASFPLTVGLCRVAVQRWSVPLVVAAPVVWVGLDFAKAHLMTGFAWYFLGHTQYRWLELIQISDVVGAYGVTAVMVLTAAAITSLIPTAWFATLKLLPPGATGGSFGPPVSSEPSDHVVKSTGSPKRLPVAPPTVTPSRRWPAMVAASVFVAVLAYGHVRRGQAEFTPGPRVALIQGNFVASLRIPEHDYEKQFLTHLRLTAHAVREQPDVIIWPEGMFRWPLTSANPAWSDDDLQRLAPQAPPSFWRDTSVRKTLITESQKTNAALIFGIGSFELTEQGIQQTNSAVFVRPETGLTGRYDKMHLVPFGEYLPLEETLPWLQKLTPYPPDFSLDAGKHAVVFEHKGWRMAPVICFEDTVPHLVRDVVAAGSEHESGSPVDVLVNLTNDGWFHGSSGLDQHLITAAFRAVECRTPVVRAVNTGISAIIDGDGAILDPEVFIDGDKQGRKSARDPKTGRWHKQLNAALMHTVPLDPRRSLYVRHGDWFATLCCGLSVFIGLTAIVPRRRMMP
ncbi:MAG: apolipoprotein N-acyltransferase [Planctomycetaceae bacterium]|nr:apolipoprotein N-acyltransferase [Planctomycetaceae bacterium]